MLAEEQRNIPNMVKYSGDAIGHFQSFHFLPLVFFVLIRSWGTEDWTRSMPFWGSSGGWGKSFQGILTLFISTCDSANASLDYIWHISACGWLTIEIQLFWRSSFGKEVGPSGHHGSQCNAPNQFQNFTLSSGDEKRFIYVHSDSRCLL